MMFHRTPGESSWGQNARAENPLVNNGVQRNAETTCVLGRLGRVLQTQRFNNAFGPILGVSKRSLTRILLQKHRDRNGSRIMIQIGVVYIYIHTN